MNTVVHNSSGSAKFYFARNTVPSNSMHETSLWPVQYRSGDYEGAVVAYLKAAEMGLEVGQSNAAWMLARGYGAAGPAASALAQKLHQRAAGQV